MKISESYDKAVKELEREKQIEFLYTDIVSMRPTTSRPVLAKVSSEFYRQNPTLNEEVFGPFSLIVTYRDQDELRELVSVLEGQLTLTVLAEEDELQGQEKLLQILSGKAGRLIFNGVPTGVEVCPSMQHGGPYPATTDSRFTSVGTSAIKRFARPVSFQSWPPSQLPPELQDDNPMKIWRLLNGSWTLDPVK